MNIEDVFRDALPIINRFAPSIAYTLGNGVGAGINFVISLLSNAYSVNPANLPELASKISSNPESEHILKELEQKNTIHNNSHLASVEMNLKLQFDDDNEK